MECENYHHDYVDDYMMIIYIITMIRSQSVDLVCWLLSAKALVEAFKGLFLRRTDSSAGNDDEENDDDDDDADHDDDWDLQRVVSEENRLLSWY